MASIRLQIIINAPIKEVAVFFVPQRMPYWYGVEIQSQFELSDGGADFLAGQKVRIGGSLGNRELTLTAMITRFEFGEILEWRFQDSAGVRGLQAWELIAESNTTKVIMRDEYVMESWLGRVMDWLFTRHAIKQRDLDALARLKRLAERT